MVNVRALSPVCCVIRKHSSLHPFLILQDLVAREEAFKKAKQEQTAHAHANQAEASVQSEGKRMREAAEAAQFAAQQFARMEENRIHTASLNARAAEKEATSSHDSIPDLQRTLRLSLPLPQSAAIISSTDSLLAYLLPTYGHISDCVILPPKAAKKKSSKGGAGDVFKEQASAMMVFGKDNLGGCWALWEDCRVGRGRVKGWKAKWAEGGVEPEWVARLGGTLQQPAPSPSSQPSSSTSKISSNSASSTSEASSAPTFSFDPSAPPPTSTSFPPPPKFSAPGPSEADYESATLLRMRQAERERLEREIREADEMED